MKKLSVLFAAVLFFLNGMAQPVITSADMPTTPDTLRFRTSSMTTGLNYQQTGMNFTWDFSSLTGNGAGADTFISMSATPFTYQAVFAFGTNNANMASPQGDFSLIPGLPLTDVLNFHKKQTANFTLAGFGASLSGITIPVKYNAPEVLYTFPVTVGTEDSSEVYFSLAIPGLGYIDIQKKRHNYVDGWGTLILPTGTYQAIRIKSVVTETDSIYLDTLGFGVSIPRDFVEYKWLTDNAGIPQLQVTEQFGLLTTWKWIDETAVPNPFSVTITHDTTICAGQPVTLTATPVGGTPPYMFIWSNFAMTPDITVSPTQTTTYSVTVADSTFAFAFASVNVTVVVCPGLTDLPGKQGMTVYPNPSNGDIIIELPGSKKSGYELRLLDISGKCLMETGPLETPAEEPLRLNLKDFIVPEPGFYLLQLRNKEEEWTEKILIR